MKVKNFKELHVWQKGIEIVDLVYELTCRFPADERYGLARHLQKTAVSIPSNIAEGFVRHHTREYQQFCRIALGSCAELETQLIIARRREHINAEQFAKLDEWLDHENRMLVNLIKSVNNNL